MYFPVSGSLSKNANSKNPPPFPIPSVWTPILSASSLSGSTSFLNSSMRSCPSFCLANNLDFSSSTSVSPLSLILLVVAAILLYEVFIAVLVLARFLLSLPSVSFIAPFLITDVPSPLSSERSSDFCLRRSFLKLMLFLTDSGGSPSVAVM